MKWNYNFSPYKRSNKLLWFKCCSLFDCYRNRNQYEDDDDDDLEKLK